MTTTSTVRSTEQLADESSRLIDLPDAVAKMAATTPDRCVVRYRDRVLVYRDLDAAINLMMPIIRGQRMDDRSAVVAAIFAGLPDLGDESDPAVVAAVVDGALSEISAGLHDLLQAAAQVTPVRAAGAGEIDLRVIASRLSGS